MKRLGIFALPIFLIISDTSVSAETDAPSKEVLELEALIEKYEVQEWAGFTIERFKMAVDDIISPETDWTDYRKTTDRIARHIEQRIGKGEVETQDLLAEIQNGIYAAGSWNDARPFQYDLIDPNGDNLKNKLISEYVATRQGNCVTMPIYMAIVAERLGLKLPLAMAPRHILLRYQATNGRWINIEATSGGYPARDEHYKKYTVITDRALEAGLYLHAMDDRQSAALIGSLVAEYLFAQGRYENAIQAANSLLRIHPRFAYLMAVKGNAYRAIIIRDFVKKYDSPKELSKIQRHEVSRLAELNISNYDKAFGLGFTLNGRRMADQQLQ